MSVLQTSHKIEAKNAVVTRGIITALRIMMSTIQGSANAVSRSDLIVAPTRNPIASWHVHTSNIIQELMRQGVHVVVLVGKMCIA